MMQSSSETSTPSGCVMHSESVKKGVCATAAAIGLPTLVVGLARAFTGDNSFTGPSISAGYACIVFQVSVLSEDSLTRVCNGLACAALITSAVMPSLGLGSASALPVLFAGTCSSLPFAVQWTSEAVKGITEWWDSSSKPTAS